MTAMLTKQFGSMDRKRVDRYDKPEWYIEYLLDRHEFPWPFLEPRTDRLIERVLRDRFGDRAVVSPRVADIIVAPRSVVDAPVGKLQKQIAENALDLTEPLRGSVALLLPFDFDAWAHALFHHPSFHCKLVLPQRVTAEREPYRAWFIWVHRGALQGRKGGPRIIYP